MSSYFSFNEAKQKPLLHGFGSWLNCTQQLTPSVAWSVYKHVNVLRSTELASLHPVVRFYVHPATLFSLSFSRHLFSRGCWESPEDRDLSFTIHRGVQTGAWGTLCHTICVMTPGPRTVVFPSDHWPPKEHHVPRVRKIDCCLPSWELMPPSDSEFRNDCKFKVTFLNKM